MWRCENVEVWKWGFRTMANLWSSTIGRWVNVSTPACHAAVLPPNGVERDEASIARCLLRRHDKARVPTEFKEFVAWRTLVMLSLIFTLFTV